MTPTTSSRCALLLSLLLTVNPVLAANRAAPEGPVPSSGASLPAVGVPQAALAAQGLLSQMGAVDRVIASPAAGLAAIESAAATPASSKASPEARALNAQAESAALVRGILLKPELLGDARVRAALTGVLGAGSVEKLDLAAERIRVAAADDRRFALQLSEARTSARATPERVSARLEAMRAALESLGARGAQSVEGGVILIDVPVSGKASSVVLHPRGLPAGSYEARQQIEAFAPEAAKMLPARSARGSWGRGLRSLIAAVAIGVGAMTASPSPALAYDDIKIEMSKRDAYVDARDVNTLVSKWSPDTHVYVIGDVRLDRQTLEALEASLNGTHWTVVLVGDHSGQSYTDGERRTHHGSDAIDFAVNQEIPRKAGFLELTNPRTGETDGAILTIVLSDRQGGLMYYASVAQNSRGLGQGKNGVGDNWIDGKRLIGLAATQMRNGLNISGAVLDTVNGINSRLESAIDSEVGGVTTSLAAAEASVNALETKAKAFAAAHPEKAETLGAPNIKGLRADLAAAKKSFEAKKIVEASRQAATAKSQADSALSAMASYEGSFSSAKNAIADAESSVQTLDAKVAAFKKSHPKATGTLTRPDIAGMKKGLAAASASLAAGETAGPARTAADTKASADRISATLDAFPGDASLIASIEHKVKEQSARERASDGAVELGRAKSEIAEARRLYENGDLEYSGHLQAAREAATQGQSAIDSADSSAAARLAWLLTLLGIFTLGTGFTLFFLNRLTRKPRKESLDLLAEREGERDEKLTAIFGDAAETELKARLGLEGRTRMLVDSGQVYEGKTAQLAERARTDGGNLFIINALFDQLFDAVKALVRPTGLLSRLFNTFWPSRYKKATGLLQDQVMEFKPDDAAEKIFKGRAKTWEEKLYGDPKAYGAFSGSHNDIMKKWKAHAKSAADALDAIEDAIMRQGPTLDTIDGAIAAATAKKAEVDAGAKDGLLKLPSLAGLIKAAERSAQSTREQVKKDPVGGLEGVGKTAVQQATQAQALAEVVLAAREKPFAWIAEDKAALEAGGIETRWVQTGLETLSEDADELVRLAAEGKSIEDGLSEWKKSVDAFMKRVDRAAGLDKARRETGLTAIAGTTEQVAAARAELSKALGLEAADMLREDKSDPDGFLAKASEYAGMAKAHLDKGELDAASEALDKAGARENEAEAIVAAARAALAAQETTVIERRAETDRLEGLEPAAEKALRRIEKAYAQTVLSLSSGDASHPNGNGTVKDNLDEAAESVQSAKDKVEKAVKVFKAGKVLEAASLLRQVAAHQEFTAHRLNEVHEKEARLTKAVADNAAFLKHLDSRVADYGSSIADDARVMQPTLKELKKAAGVVEAARSAVEAEKGDPFQAADELAKAKAALDAVLSKANNDRDIFAEAERSVKAAASAIATARANAQAAKGDSIADSPEIRAAYEKIDDLARELSRAQDWLTKDHDDWFALDQEADRIAMVAATVSATLKGEMAEAQRASGAISDASRKIKEAGSWTGRYVGSIPGTPGSGQLSEARQRLEQGDYPGAIAAAERAKSTAAAAIREAEEEDDRRHRAELRRQEEERQRREAERRAREAAEAAARRRREEAEEAAERSRRSSSSGGGFGGGGGGWGGSSSGSSSGGWGGSSSGSSRGGW